MSLVLNTGTIPAGGEFDYYGQRYATFDSNIKIFSVQTGEILSIIPLTLVPVTSLSWSDPSCGNFLAFSSQTFLYIYKESTQNVWDQVFQDNDFKKNITSLSWAPDHLGLHLLVSSEDSSVSIFSYKSQSEWKKNSFIAHSGPVFSASWMYNEKIMNFVTHGESIKIWQWSSGSAEMIREINEEFLDVKGCKSNELVAACDYNRVVLFDKKKRFEMVQVKSPGGNYLQWSEYGNVLMVSGKEISIIRRFPAEGQRWGVVQRILEDGSLELVN